MARPKATVVPGSVLIPSGDYERVVALMDELAFRGPSQEALMMRVAKAAGFTEVMTAIKRRRIYTKKMQAAGASAPAQPREPRPKGKGRRARKPATPPPQPANDGVLSIVDAGTPANE